jgi:hypothetical protein
MRQLLRPVAHRTRRDGLGDNFTELRPINLAAFGSIDAFDPLAQLPVATTLARTWSPDARLTSLELQGIAENGKVDLRSAAAGGNSAFGVVVRARYQFASKGRDIAAKAMVKVSEKVVWTAIDIILEKGELRAVVSPNSSDDRDPTPITFGCQVPQIIETWRASGLPFRKGYALTLRDTIGRGPPSWTSADWGVPSVDLACKSTR